MKGQKFLCVILLVTLCLWGSLSFEASAQTPELFSSLTDIAVGQTLTSHPAYIRSRYVSVNFDYLGGVERPLAGPQEITLNLFDDVAVSAVRDRVERRSDTQYSWFGHIPDTQQSLVIMTVEHGSMAGHIWMNGKLYGIQPLGGESHALIEIDQQAFPEGAHDYMDFSESSNALANQPPPVSDDGSIIDVMVVYTPRAAQASGNIVAEIQNAIDSTNQSYANSGIRQRIRLVHTEQVNYTESGWLCDINNTLNDRDDLARLREPNDGFIDNVHALRNTYGADLVSLIVEDSQDNYAGCASSMRTVASWFESRAFSVVVRRYATSNLSFAHELGHNMGAQHDWYVDQASTPYAYSHGYVYVPARWRTIMAYRNECSDQGVSCPKIPNWSNPDVRYNNVATGVPEGSYHAADNRKTLNNTAYTVANFRTQVNTCTYSLSPTSRSFTSSGGTGSASVSASSGCAWTAVSNASWITVTGGQSGNGSGTVWFSVATNFGTSSRTGTLTIAGKTLTVTQQGATPAYTITATAGLGGSISPSGKVSVTQGASQTFTIASNIGYRILDVRVDGVSVGVRTSYTFSNVTTNHSITATFTSQLLTITASAGAGGSISPSGNVSVAYGGSQPFTITPNSGYRIANVYVNGSSVGAVSSYAFSYVRADQTISAIFERIPVVDYTITATVIGSGGSISPSGEVSVDQGDSQTFSISASSGYRILDVRVDGISVGARTSYTFTNVTSNHTISASFEPVPVTTHRITASAGAGGNISPSGVLTVTEHADQTFAITPDDGYQIEDVVVDDVSQGAVTNYEFLDVITDHAIEASFKTASGTVSAYFGFEEFGGAWQDAEKSLDNPDDDWLCWAAAASNILDWTGWNVFDSVQDAFYTFQNYWTDAGGLMEYGWQWWFDGTEPPDQQGWAQLNDGWAEAENGGSFWTDYNFFDYFYEEWAWDSFSGQWGDGTGLMAAIDQYLHSGYGTTLAVYSDSGGHALTAWGYEYDEFGNYTGVYVTDSDDYMTDLKLLSVSLVDDRWYLDQNNDYGYQDWFIGGVQALDRRNPIPEPGTLILIVLGLLSLRMLVRKHIKH